MSKSKGEFLTVSLLEQKGYDPLAYRFFCLQSHYRKSSRVHLGESGQRRARLQQARLPRSPALKPDDGGVDEAVRDRVPREVLHGSWTTT